MDSLVLLIFKIVLLVLLWFFIFMAVRAMSSATRGSASAVTQRFSERTSIGLLPGPGGGGLGPHRQHHR